MVTQEAKDLGGRIADLEGRGRAIGSNKLGRSKCAAVGRTSWEGGSGKLDALNQ